MAKIKVKCANCQAEKEIEERPAPVTAKEKVQIYFVCRSCGSANLRNGTAKLIRKPKKEPKKAKLEPKIEAPEPKEIKNGNEPKETRQASEDTERTGFGFY